MVESERREATLPSEEISERPLFRPSVEVWDLCVRLGRKHRLTPSDVIKRLMWVGKEIGRLADEDEQDRFTYKKKSGNEIVIKLFTPNGNGNGNGNRNRQE